MAVGKAKNDLAPGAVARFADIEFVWIPAGKFMMGAQPNELDSENDEKPGHSVTLTQGYWLGKYAVSKAQWQAVMATKLPWSKHGVINTEPDSPAVCVSWDDIVNDFLPVLNEANPGTTFRLPTEAEWEHACRAGTSNRFSYGDDPGCTQLGDYAWYRDNSSACVHAVGKKLPNSWGLYDMHGNVWEWCQDWYGAYRSTAQTNPRGPVTGTFRVLRGGSWDTTADNLRSAYRSFSNPDGCFNLCGFRLLRTP